MPSSLLQFVNSLFRTCYNNWVTISANSTSRVKTHLVASLPTSRQQVVFALLVPSCQQFWNKLLTTCNNLVDIIRLVVRLFLQVRHSHDIGNIVTILCRQPCNACSHCLFPAVVTSLERAVNNL
jgi:hypothetical protein